MPTAKSLPSYSPFGLYLDLSTAAETALSYWSDYLKATSDATVWWTERWLQAPRIFGAWARIAAPMADKAVETPVEVAAASMETAAKVVEAAVEVPAAAVEHAAAVVESVVEEARPEPDDLTMLVGIGPKLAAALAERGVTRFAQLAAWTEKDLAEVDKALDLKGRAVRDAWVAQARRLASDS